MTKLVELDLEFDFATANNAFQFDCDELHGTSSAKRVDFVAEFDDCYRFIEVKDPDQPDAVNPEAFITKFQSKNLVDSLAGKFRDTLFFRSLCVEHDRNKKIEYIVLLSCEALEPAMIMAKQDILHRKIPIQHAQWAENSAVRCVLINLSQYKRIYGETSVRRISEGAG
jgi:hypothetical protein